jgi:hypothetical protein
MDQLRKGDFAEDARFTVWVIPRQLCTEAGASVVPLMNVRYAEFRHLVNKAEWKVLKGTLVQFYRKMALGADVPLFWWHSEEQDREWEIHRDGVTDSVPLASVLSA